MLPAEGPNSFVFRVGQIMLTTENRRSLHKGKEKIMETEVARINFI